ncbi:MAG: hypothetical protein L0K54_12055 [Tetragenococcus koreensis]|nr:hypothetical protein [Tetragenococcus koreensis]
MAFNTYFQCLRDQDSKGLEYPQILQGMEFNQATDFLQQLAQARGYKTFDMDKEESSQGETSGTTDTLREEKPTLRDYNNQPDLPAPILKFAKSESQFNGIVCNKEENNRRTNKNAMDIRFQLFCFKTQWDDYGLSMDNDLRFRSLKFLLDRKTKGGVQRNKVETFDGLCAYLCNRYSSFESTSDYQEELSLLIRSGHMKKGLHSYVSYLESLMLLEIAPVNMRAAKKSITTVLAENGYSSLTKEVRAHDGPFSELVDFMKDSDEYRDKTDQVKSKPTNKGSNHPSSKKRSTGKQGQQDQQRQHNSRRSYKGDQRSFTNKKNDMVFDVNTSSYSGDESTSDDNVQIRKVSFPKWSKADWKNRELRMVFKKMENITSEEEPVKILSNPASSRDLKLFMKVQVAQKNVHVQADSGATHNFISTHVLRLFNLMDTLVRFDSPIPSDLAAGGSAWAIGSITINLRFLNPTVDVQLEFKVFESNSIDFCIGVEGMQVMGLSLHTVGRTFDLVDAWHNTTIYTGKLVTLKSSKVSIQTMSFDLGKTNMNVNQTRQIVEELIKYDDCFLDKGVTPQIINIEPATIKLKPGASSVVHSPARYLGNKSKKLKDILDGLLDTSTISTSRSPFASRALLVHKKDEQNGRLVIDYKDLNQRVIREHYPAPHIHKTLQAMAGKRYISTFDLASGFWQLPLDTKSREFTSFTTQYGAFKYNCVPMGLTTAPAILQRTMDQIFAGLQYNICQVFADDIYVFSDTFAQHKKHIGQVLERCRQYGLQLRRNKIQIMREKTNILGFTITDDGLALDEEKIASIRNFPVPKDAKALATFIGMASFVRTHIPNLATIQEPLSRLKKKGNAWIWGDEQQKAFEKIKALLISPPVLRTYNPDFKSELHVDASDYGVGACMLQRSPEGKVHVLGYASRLLNESEQKWPITQKEGYAVIFGIDKFHDFCEAGPFTIITDHSALIWLFNNKEIKNDRVWRWRTKLSIFDYTFVYKPGRVNSIPDALSRSPMKIGALDMPSLKKLNILNRQHLVQATAKDPELAVELDNPREGFEVKNNLLYRLRKGKQYLVVPASLRSEILYLSHNHVSAGHSGFAKTWKRLNARFYWKNMEEDCKTYCTNCERCLRVKGNIRVGHTQASTHSTDRGRKVAMDYAGPYHVPLGNGKKEAVYALLIMDMHSRFCQISAVPSTDGRAFLPYWYEWINNHGIPDTVVSDNGPPFDSSIVGGHFIAGDATQQMVAPYHQSSNGMVESLVGVLKNMIATGMPKRPSTVSPLQHYATYLPVFAFAHNTSYHSVLHDTPFYVQNHYDPKTLLDFDHCHLPPAEVSYISEDQVRDTFTNLHDQINRDVVLEKIPDLEHGNQLVEYQLNALVMKRRMVPLKKGGPPVEQDNWDGPFRVTRVYETNTLAEQRYDLVSISNRKQHYVNFHGKFLKPYLKIPTTTPVVSKSGGDVGNVDTSQGK